MFTGLVQSVAMIAQVQSFPPGKRLVVEAAGIDAIDVGESIAINGCCLTAVAFENGRIHFEAGPETLARTNLGSLKPGSRVNLEQSLRVGDRLGGHYVTGHVDALGALVQREDQRDWSTFWFSMPAWLAPQLAPKGSIAIDGVSLTLVEVRADRFSVALIPHTLSATTLGALRPGDAVNLESDLLAKYVAAQLNAGAAKS